jgi:hypothetical protein
MSQTQPSVTGPPGQAAAEPTTAELVKGLADDASLLVKQEIQLAKQEVTEGLTVAARGGALLAVAGVVGLYALGFLFTTAAWGLEALGLPKSASFGIVTLFLLIVAGIAALVGQRQLKQSKVKPERAQAEFEAATAELQAEAKIAAESVKADLTGQAQAAKAEAQSAPAKAKASAGAAVGDIRDAATNAAQTAQQAAVKAKDKAKDQITTRLKRNG